MVGDHEARVFEAEFADKEAEDSLGALEQEKRSYEDLARVRVLRPPVSLFLFFSHFVTEKTSDADHPDRAEGFR